MELPEDVVRLIREYSRPVFKYLKEYNRAMKVLGMKNWAKLKEKLHTEPERVLPVLLIYQDAFEKKTEVYLLRDEQKNKQHASETERWVYENALYNRLFYAKRNEEELFWTLVRLLYGELISYRDVKIER